MRAGGPRDHGRPRGLTIGHAARQVRPGSASVTSHRISFSAVVFEWRGPSPFHFVAVPDEQADWIRQQAASVTYGWGMVPVSCTIGGTAFTTSLWPKDGGYFLPLKDSVRRSEGIGIGDETTVDLSLRVG